MNPTEAIEQIIDKTLRAAEPAERLLTDPDVRKSSIGARTLQREFQSKGLDWSKGTPMAVPLASRARIGELGFVLQCLVNPELLIERHSEFLLALAEVRLKQHRREQERVSQPEHADAVAR